MRTASGERKFAVSVTHWEGVSGMGVSAPYRTAAQTKTKGKGWLRAETTYNVTCGAFSLPGSARK